MNVLQSFVYAFSLLFFAIALIRDKENRSIVLTIGFIGGFLFSILWEASGRYAFPYFMLLIPLASGAAGTIMETAENIVLSKIKKKDEKMIKIKIIIPWTDTQKLSKLI